MSRTRDTMRDLPEDWSAVAPVILYDAHGRVTAKMSANDFKASRRGRWCRRHWAENCRTCGPAMPAKAKVDPSLAMTWQERPPEGRSAAARKAAAQRWMRTGKA